MLGGGPRHDQVPDTYAVVRSGGVRGKDVLTLSLNSEGSTETCDVSCPEMEWGEGRVPLFVDRFDDLRKRAHPPPSFFFDLIVKEEEFPEDPPQNT